MPLILGTNSIKDTGYDVANSCRFDGSSAYFRKTLGTATNSKKYTISMWLKRGKLGTSQTLISYYPVGNLYENIHIDPNDRFYWYHRTAGATVYSLITNRKFRDTSAWYHFVISVDSTQSTASDRIKLYINGVQETSFSTANYPDQDRNFEINKANPVDYFRFSDGSAFYDGYVAEFVFIDGTAYNQNSFGEFDEDSPTIWKPKDVSDLTFGNNGFYLDFEDSSNLGNDVNGGTDLTEYNLAATDQATDTCTNNFATLNSLFATQDSGTITEGNTIYTASANAWGGSGSTIGLSQGKWYFEIQLNNNAGGHFFGVIDETANVNNNPHQRTGSTFFYSAGEMYRDGSSISSGHGTFGASDIGGVALNLDDNEITIYKNGSAIVTDFALSTTKNTLFVWVMGYNSGSDQLKVNFGGSPPFTISSGNADGNGYGNFEYSPPSNYYSLCTKNLSEFG